MKRRTLSLFTFPSLLALTAVAALADHESGASVRGSEPARPGIERIVPVPGPVPAPDLDVAVWTDRGDRASYCSGEPIQIFFRATRDSYVTIYDLDTRGRVNVIFPNAYHRDNFVRGGMTYRLPAGGGYHFEVEGPRGWEHLRAVATTDPGCHFRHGEEPPFWSSSWGAERRVAPGELDGVIAEKIAVVPGDLGLARAETSLFVDTGYRCRSHYGWRPPWWR